MPNDMASSDLLTNEVTFLPLMVSDSMFWRFVPVIETDRPTLNEGFANVIETASS